MEEIKDLHDEESREVQDEAACEVDGEAPSTDITDLESRIEELEEERDRFKELAARAQADLINYRTRMEREMSRTKELACERSALEMFPVLDNLDRVLQVKDGSDLDTVVEGIRMVRKQFLSALEALGVETVESVGKSFSPQYHEAIGMVEVEDEEQDGIVVDEFQTGYVLAGKVIRPAKVRVGSYKV